MDKREEHELVFSISTGRPVVKREIVLNRDGFVNSKIDRDFQIYSSRFEFAESTNMR